MSKPTLTERVIHLENVLGERVGVIEHTANRNQACIAELADALLGTPKTALQGGGRNPDGVTHRVQRIEDLLSNGGIRVKWSKGQWLAIATVLAAVITAIGTVLA